MSVSNNKSEIFNLKSAMVCLLCVLSISVSSCRRDMQDQPKMKPFRSSTFYGDGLSTRPPIDGTVARGFLKEDKEFFTGKKATQTGMAPSQSGTAVPVPKNATEGAAAYPDDVEVFPIAVTKDLVTRGKQRYEIFCSACHGYTGNGDGMIVRRGFRRAASFNDDRLRYAPVGHFFDAITNGWGAMPSYAPQIPPEDRWAIVAYIRALQLSQKTPEASVTPTPTHSGGHQ